MRRGNRCHIARPAIAASRYPDYARSCMARPAPADPAVPARWTTEQYLRLVDDGVLGPDDKVELLEGVIVAMAPSNVAHRGETIAIAALPGVDVAADDLLP